MEIKDELRQTCRHVAIGCWTSSFFEVLAKNSLDDMCLATPALVRGSILIRTASKLYRIKGSMR